MNFFDNYPEFYKTSNTKAYPNRLNNRYFVLIENNKDLIQDQSILDIASHDGRWSFAAIKNGARQVLGIEGRKDLVDKAINNMKKYEIPEDKYEFIVGDIHEEIKTIKSDIIDVVFCFGFFYHTIHHMYLLSEIKRLNPKYLILDTVISTSDSVVIDVLEEDSNVEAYAIKNSTNYDINVVVGHPSKKALELMLNKCGFSIKYYNWHNGRIKNWEHLESYHNHARVSLVAKNLKS